MSEPVIDTRSGEVREATDSAIAPLPVQRSSTRTGASGPHAIDGRDCALDQELGLGTRHQHAGAHGKIESHELALSDDVGD